MHEADEECHARVEKIVEQKKAGTGITEELKAAEQLKWVGLMNNVRSAAEKIALRKVIYIRMCVERKAAPHFGCGIIWW